MNEPHSVDVASPLERYPRAYDDRVLYNVPEETIEYFRPIYWPETTEVRVRKTVEAPPPLTDDEADEAHVAARQCVLNYLDRNGVPRWDELNEEIFGDLEFVVQGEQQAGISLDRTLIVVMLQHQYFTPAFVRSLQTCFLKDRPLWRAGVCSSPEEDDLTIYHDVVRVGDVLCPPADFATEIENWQRRIQDQRANELQARRREIRQFRYLKRIVPQHVKRLNESGLLFVAAFEHAERKRDNCWYTVVAIVNEASRDFWTVSPERTTQSPSYEYPISAEGTIGKRAGHWGEAPYRMLQFELPRLDCPTLVVGEGHYYQSEEVGLLPDGKRWSFQVAPEVLITDDELRRMEADGELD